MIDDAYLAFLRTKPCALCPAAASDAHHIRNRAWREVKRNDATCAPLCRECHQLVHNQGLAHALNARGITIWRLVETVGNYLVEYYEARMSGVSVEVGL